MVFLIKKSTNGDRSYEHLGLNKTKSSNPIDDIISALKGLTIKLEVKFTDIVPASASALDPAPAPIVPQASEPVSTAALTRIAPAATASVRAPALANVTAPALTRSAPQVTTSVQAPALTRIAPAATTSVQAPALIHSPSPATKSVQVPTPATVPVPALTRIAPPSITPVQASVLTRIASPPTTSVQGPALSLFPVPPQVPTVPPISVSVPVPAVVPHAPAVVPQAPAPIAPPVQTLAPAYNPVANLIRGEISVGKTIETCCISVDSSTTPPGAYITYNDANLIKIAEIINEISNDIEEQPHINVINIGDIVIGKSRDDNQWYRSIVEKVDGEATDVYYFDWGVREKNLTKDRIKHLLKPELGLSSYPACALKLKFREICPKKLDDVLGCETTYRMKVESYDNSTEAYEVTVLDKLEGF